MEAHKHLEQILSHNRDGSYSTKAARSDILHQCVNNLNELGSRRIELQNLKPKHVEKLVEHWKDKGLKSATIYNKVSHLRWLTQKLNKQNIIPRTNAELGVENRSYVATVDRSQPPPTVSQLEKFTAREKLSIDLQREFGMRRKESLKFNHTQALSPYSDKVKMTGSWCKGGRPRTLEIRTQSQRDLIDKVKAIVPKNESMIPKGQSYKSAMMAISNKCYLADIRQHGNRHAYAQGRYLELTGRHSPVKGIDPPIRDEIDKMARAVITRELGHSRLDETNSYLGSSS